MRNAEAMMALGKVQSKSLGPITNSHLARMSLLVLPSGCFSVYWGWAAFFRRGGEFRCSNTWQHQPSYPDTTCGCSKVTSLEAHATNRLANVQTVEVRFEITSLAAQQPKLWAAMIVASVLILLAEKANRAAV